jgi:hypothetical protein
MSTSRYSSSTSSYDVPSMPYMPPQNLTAEAVAALPPPGMVNSCSPFSRYRYRQDLTLFLFR